MQQPLLHPCNNLHGLTFVASRCHRAQDARDFGTDGYSLRVQHKFSRHIKLLICVTLYNEDQETLGKTLLGICEVGRRARLLLGGGALLWLLLLLAPAAAAQAQWPRGSRPHPSCYPPPQNLEVLYRQYGRDGNKHGLDWQEVAVAIIQDGVTHCDSSVLAASTVTVRPSRAAA